MMKGHYQVIILYVRKADIINIFQVAIKNIGVGRCSVIRGLRLQHSMVGVVGWARHDVGGSGGMLAQEILDFCVTLDQLWCILRA